METKEYLVRWEINVGARSAREAAELARQIHNDPDTMATIYQVTEGDCGDSVEIDVAEIDLEWHVVTYMESRPHQAQMQKAIRVKAKDPIDAERRVRRQMEVDEDWLTRWEFIGYDEEDYLSELPTFTPNPAS